ncbi:hypothetical protein ACYZT8_03250 [Pseudomonas sp. LB3P93]
MSKDRNSREDQSLGDKMKAGEPMMERAVQALRRYHETQETQPAEKVEKLRHETEALFAVVHEYQCLALGGPSPRLH